MHSPGVLIEALAFLGLELPLIPGNPKPSHLQCSAWRSRPRLMRRSGPMRRKSVQPDSSRPAWVRGGWAALGDVDMCTTMLKSKASPMSTKKSL